MHRDEMRIHIFKREQEEFRVAKNFGQKEGAKVQGWGWVLKPSAE